LGEQALDLARRAEDPMLETLGRWFLGVVQFALGDYTAALEQTEHVLAFYQPELHHRPYVHLRASDPGPSALAYQACCLWCLGYPDQALARSQEALALARELDHPFTLADVLCYGGCMVGVLRRDADAVQRNAEAIMQVAGRNVPPWMVTACRYRGEALLMQGRFEEGLAVTRQALIDSAFRGHMCFITGTYCALAEAHARTGQIDEGLAVIEEVLSFVEQSDERHFEAEIYRLRAELQLGAGNQAEAEASFLKAVDIARRQCARSWELRASTGLARLWQRQGRLNDAYELLAGVYGWFTEGFDTADLEDARAVLDELQDQRAG
jgi:predicted ATPase